MATLIYALIAAIFLAAPAVAQSTRVDTIEAQQAEKAKGLGSEGPSDAELIIQRVLLSPLLSGGDGAYPWFGSVYGGTGMGLGAGFLKRLEHGAYFNAQTGISINSSMVLRGTFASPQLWDGRLQVDASGQWLKARDVSFYGLGQDSSQSTRQRYDYTPKEFGGSATFKPMRFVSIIGGYSFLEFGTAHDVAIFPAAGAPGLGEELRYQVARITLALDSRPAPGYSTRGGFARASFERNREVKGRPYSVNLQEYEAVQQVPLVREQFVLAARGLITLTTPDEGHEVPVVLAPYLGSGSTLRGFANRRFTDRNRALVSGEYRWRPSRYLDMALFVDAGKTTASREWDMRRLKTSYGIGVRFHAMSFTALRIELARTGDGPALVFGFGPSF
jgi:hypothetical protein